jgi:hypothetical protein
MLESAFRDGNRNRRLRVGFDEGRSGGASSSNYTGSGYWLLVVGCWLFAIRCSRRLGEVVGPVVQAFRPLASVSEASRRRCERLTHECSEPRTPKAPTFSIFNILSKDS